MAESQAEVYPMRLDVGDKVLVIGTSRSGKTTLIERLVYENQSKFNVIWVFCGTLSVSKSYSWNEPFLVSLSAVTRMGGESPALQMKKIVRAQVLVAEMCEAERRLSPTMLLIFDDFLGQKDLGLYEDHEFWGPWMSSLRHYSMSVIFSLQYLHDSIPPSMRDSMDSVYTFSTNAGASAYLACIPGLKINDKMVCTASEKVNIINGLLATQYQCIYFSGRLRIFGHLFMSAIAPPFILRYGARTKK